MNGNLNIKETFIHGFQPYTALQARLVNHAGNAGNAKFLQAVNIGVTFLVMAEALIENLVRQEQSAFSSVAVDAGSSDVLNAIRAALADWDNVVSVTRAVVIQVPSAISAREIIAFESV